ncbi:MAG TPA: PH domain-containing protein [Gaiellaceae bacterium]|nr:PH domain-containing protein [Gaiellaceae bacterium]
MPADESERIYVDARRHGVVLVRPLGRALLISLLGAIAFLGGWPVSAAGAALLCLAAVGAVAAVWRFDRTRVVLTGEKLFVVHGTLRRRAAAVRLEKIQTVEVEQTLLGRLLGYGTLVAGDLEISCVARPADVQGFLSKALSGT